MTTTETTTREEEAGRRLAEIAVNMNEYSHGYDAFAKAFAHAYYVVDDIGGGEAIKSSALAAAYRAEVERRLKADGIV